MKPSAGMCGDRTGLQGPRIFTEFFKKKTWNNFKQSPSKKLKHIRIVESPVLDFEHASQSISIRDLLANNWLLLVRLFKMVPKPIFHTALKFHTSISKTVVV